MVQAFHPVGECIYCGGREGLSDEHILPYGLGGRMVLPSASCRQCATITGRFEGAVLRGSMREARAVAGYPTRRPRERPTEIEFRALSGDSVVPAVRSREDAPAFFLLPMFEPPRYMSGQSYGTGVNICGVETIHFGADPREVVDELGADGFQVHQTVPATELAQLIAKAGYAFYIASNGLFPREESPILPMILEGRDDGANWVGSREYSLQVESQRPTHALAAGEERRADGSVFGLARVKLFSECGATGYEVVVRAPGWQGYVPTA